MAPPWPCSSCRASWMALVMASPSPRKPGGKPQSTRQHQHPKTLQHPSRPRKPSGLLVGPHGAAGWLLPTPARWDPTEQGRLLPLGGAQGRAQDGPPVGDGFGNPPRGRLDGLVCRSLAAPWLGVRDWQLLIFKLGELEALGSSEPLGLAVRFSGCEVSCSRGGKAG